MDKQLIIKKDGELIVDFKYYERINEIRGESGSGKTKMIRDISNILKLYKNNTGRVESNIQIDKIQIMDDNSIEHNNFSNWDTGGYLIFIDNYDRKFNDHLYKFVRESKNTFFLISRVYGLAGSSRLGANMLKYDGKTYRLVNRIRDLNEYLDMYMKYGY